MDDIGFHWEYIDDYRLWAHEGFHGWQGGGSETDAQLFQFSCPIDPVW